MSETGKIMDKPVYNIRSASKNRVFRILVEYAKKDEYFSEYGYRNFLPHEEIAQHHGRPLRGLAPAGLGLVPSADSLPPGLSPGEPASVPAAPEISPEEAEAKHDEEL